MSSFLLKAAVYLRIRISITFQRGALTYLRGWYSRLEAEVTDVSRAVIGWCAPSQTRRCIAFFSHANTTDCSWARSMKGGGCQNKSSAKVERCRLCRTVAVSQNLRDGLYSGSCYCDLWTALTAGLVACTHLSRTLLIKVSDGLVCMLWSKAWVLTLNSEKIRAGI